MLARAPEQNDKGQGLETKIVSRTCAVVAFPPLSATALTSWGNIVGRK